MYYTQNSSRKLLQTFLILPETSNVGNFVLWICIVI